MSAKIEEQPELRTTIFQKRTFMPTNQLIDIVTT